MRKNAGCGLVWGFLFINKRLNKENAKFHFIEFGNDFTLSKTSAIV